MNESAGKFYAHSCQVQEISYTLVNVAGHISEKGLTFSLKQGTLRLEKRPHSSLFFGTCSFEHWQFYKYNDTPLQYMVVRFIMLNEAQ